MCGASWFNKFLGPARADAAHERFSGIYCLLVVATLLDLLTPELVRGTEAFIAG